MRQLRSALFAAFLAAGSAASAFTPENGTWWNPQEPGSGYLIEIQDNFLFLAVYNYHPDGRPMFYTSQGVMNGNARFVGSLSTFASTRYVIRVRAPRRPRWSRCGPSA